MRMLTLVVLTVFSIFANATSAEWITYYTKGKISYDEARKISRLIYLYSFDEEVDPNDVFRIAAVESKFDKRAKSNHGAKGIMQVMPRPHRSRLKRGENFFALDANIRVGIEIYSENRQRFRTRAGALQAYNGSFKNLKYVRLVDSVILYECEEPYKAGSDNRKLRVLQLASNP